jgi:hypothetical protein
VSWTPGSHADCVPGTVLPDPDRNIASRLTYAFFRLADQRIGAVEPAPINHSAQVIAQRAATTPDVRIVRLRATAREAGHVSRAVDWSHRWVVQSQSPPVVPLGTTKQDHPPGSLRQGPS